MPDFAEPLATEAAFFMLALRDESYPLDELGRTTLELSERLRALGIILLLTRGDTDGFYYNLIRSGRGRRAWLTRVQAAAASCPRRGLPPSCAGRSPVAGQNGP